MIFTKALSYKEIINNIDKEQDIISLVGCETCVRVAGVGGEDKVRTLALKLKEDGYNVLDGYMIPACCTPKVYFAKMDPRVTTVISVACNAGTNNLKRFYGHLKVIDVAQDIGLMVDNTDDHILQITMPFKKGSDELGKEYKSGTGEKLPTNDNLFGKEVTK